MLNLGSDSLKLIEIHHMNWNSSCIETQDEIHVNLGLS
jgi:hypothetical protein